jgi:LPXTG-motif cell wall-anchored protein
MRLFFKKRLLFPFLLASVALPALNAMAVEPALPFKSDETDFPVQGQVAIVVLGLILLLLFCFLGWKRKRGNAKGAARWLKWLPARQNDDGIKVLNSKRIAGNTSVHVVEWEGGKVLLAIGEQGVVRLGEMQSPTSPGKNPATIGEAS